MIKAKIDLNGNRKPILILWLDGEFQTIYGDGKEYCSVEECLERAKEIQKLVPFKEIEITKEALAKLSCLYGVTII